MKQILKKIAPKWLRQLYWLSRVMHVKVLKWVPAYDEDELVTAHHCDFMQDRHFMRCYDAAVEAGLAVSTTIHWRAHVCCWAATRAAKLNGDFVECGVNKGFLSKIVMDYVNFSTLPATFYLLDTYDGLVDRYLREDEKRNGIKAGGYEPCYDVVKKVFQDFKNVRIVRGAIPETLPQAAASRVAYLSIDMNCVIPEIEAINYFWDKLVPGATVILDDYGHSGHEFQKQAFDDFAKKKSVPILSLPTGQGLIVKP